MELTDKQLSTLAKLEDAFKSCHAAGLAFVGMDGSIHAYDAAALRRASGPENDIYEGQGALDQGRKVWTHGAYLDSGGW